VLRQIFDAAVASADPGAAVLRHLPEKPSGRCVVVGAGKASVAMAAALDAAWGDVDLSGVIVTRHGQGAPAGRIEVLEASHPTPDAMSEEAGRRILAAVQGLTADDLVIALISGGGSSLMVLPAGEMTLADKQAVNRSLLASGANIVEMNAVRKHLSRIKGGRLALAARPARVVTLAISDIPGDDPAAIASGPTVADPSTLADVHEIVARYGIDLPPAASAALATCGETPKELPSQNSVRVVVAPTLALAAAARAASNAGLTPLVLGDAIEGESRELGIVMAGIARSIRRNQLRRPRGGSGGLARAPDQGLGGPRPDRADLRRGGHRQIAHFGLARRADGGLFAHAAALPMLALSSRQRPLSLRSTIRARGGRDGAGKPRGQARKAGKGAGPRHRKARRGRAADRRHDVDPDGDSLPPARLNAVSEFKFSVHTGTRKP
jgi:glycerate-2-kinase